MMVFLFFWELCFLGFSNSHLILETKKLPLKSWHWRITPYVYLHICHHNNTFKKKLKKFSLSKRHTYVCICRNYSSVNKTWIQSSRCIKMRSFCPQYLQLWSCFVEVQWIFSFHKNIKQKDQHFFGNWKLQGWAISNSSPTLSYGLGHLPSKSTLFIKKQQSM